MNARVAIFFKKIFKKRVSDENFSCRRKCSWRQLEICVKKEWMFFNYYCLLDICMWRSWWEKIKSRSDKVTQILRRFKSFDFWTSFLLRVDSSFLFVDRINDPLVILLLYDCKTIITKQECIWSIPFYTNLCDLGIISTPMTQEVSQFAAFLWTIFQSFAHVCHLTV